MYQLFVERNDAHFYRTTHFLNLYIELTFKLSNLYFVKMVIYVVESKYDNDKIE